MKDDFRVSQGEARRSGQTCGPRPQVSQASSGTSLRLMGRFLLVCMASVASRCSGLCLSWVCHRKGAVGCRGGM